MRWTLERLTQPAIEPVTLAQARLQVKEYDDITERDSELTALIVAAREWAEDYTGCVLIDQTWRLTVDNGRYIPGGDNRMTGIIPGYYCGAFNFYGRGEIRLQRSPILAITSVSTVDGAGVETVVSANTYQLREPAGKWPRILLLDGGTWGCGTIRVVFRAGFADRTGSPTQDASAVPERFKQAVKLWCEAMYDRDEKMMPLLLQVAQNLIKPESTDLQFA